MFAKTEGFRHDSIAAGVAMVSGLAREGALSAEATEDAAIFSDEGLAVFRAVVWLNTTGDVLDEAQQAAFERFVRSGGGWVGVHSAADSKYHWPFYGVLLAGAWFRSHPAIQTARIEVRAVSPCCSHWVPDYVFEDEWYNFRANPADDGAQVLLALDETSYDPGADAMGADHPIAWRREVDAGRAWYTGLGRRSKTFADVGFRRHLAAGIRWAARIPAGDCDHDRQTDSREVRLAVDIALDRAELRDCVPSDVDADGTVTVDDIVEAVAYPFS